MTMLVNKIVRLTSISNTLERHGRSFAAALCAMSVRRFHKTSLWHRSYHQMVVSWQTCIRAISRKILTMNRRRFLPHEIATSIINKWPLLNPLCSLKHANQKSSTKLLLRIAKDCSILKSNPSQSKESIKKESRGIQEDVGEKEI